VAKNDFGPWDPLGVEATIEILSGAPFRWWFCGGRALDLYLGKTWRDHEDTDVGINRSSAVALPSILSGWDIHLAAGGRLLPWTGEEPDGDLQQNNLWCRRDMRGPWVLDVIIGEGNDEVWIYRREPSIRYDWDEAVLRTANGLPYLAPELQLLFKSKNRREKDDIDARMVIPELEDKRRGRLAQLLPPNHPWHELIVSSA
jgi:hypothetical protein